MGRQKDAWMELYGNSVLNNTLQVSPSELEGFPRLKFSSSLINISGEDRAAPVEEKPVRGLEPGLLQGRPG